MPIFNHDLFHSNSPATVPLQLYQGSHYLARSRSLCLDLYNASNFYKRGSFFLSWLCNPQGAGAGASCMGASPGRLWHAREPRLQEFESRLFLQQSSYTRQEWATGRKTRQNGRKMTSFRGVMAKLGACVDNELGGSALHQCR